MYYICATIYNNCDYIYSVLSKKCDSKKLCMGLWGKAITIAKSATVPKKPLFYRELSPKSDHNEKSATVPKKPFFGGNFLQKAITMKKVRQYPKNRFFGGNFLQKRDRTQKTVFLGTLLQNACMPKSFFGRFGGDSFEKATCTLTQKVRQYPNFFWWTFRCGQLFKKHIMLQLHQYHPKNHCLGHPIYIYKLQHKKKPHQNAIAYHRICNNIYIYRPCTFSKKCDNIN